jgi:hypothetical protein
VCRPAELLALVRDKRCESISRFRAAAVSAAKYVYSTSPNWTFRDSLLTR